jgi:hypothetical protein
LLLQLKQNLPINHPYIITALEAKPANQSVIYHYRTLKPLPHLKQTLPINQLYMVNALEVNSHISLPN